MATTSGELREILIEAIEAVRKDLLAPDAAKSIAMLAQQVNASLAAEIMARREEKDIDADRVLMIGQLVLGEQANDEATEKHPGATRRVVRNLR